MGCLQILKETLVSFARPSVARLGAALFALLLVALLVITGSRAAFTAQTVNPDNSIATVDGLFTDNDGGSPMFSVVDLVPGETRTACITLRYLGPSPFTADLSAALTDNADDLAKDVTVIVEEAIATGDNTFPACDTWTAGTPVYVGSLENLAAVSPVPAPTPSVFTTDQRRIYRFQITVPLIGDVFGKNVSADFLWDGTSA